MSIHASVEAFIANQNATSRVDFGDAITLGVQLSHEDRSKQEIQNLARLAETGDALVVGPGRCHDIPLRFLGEYFDRVHVVEIDVESTKEQAMQLEPEIRAKIDIEKIDLSGLVNDIDSTVQSETYPELSAKIAKLFQAFDPWTQLPELGDSEYDFACSHLVTSQLAAMPLMHLGGVSWAKFRQNIADNYLLPETVISTGAQRIIKETPKAHIDRLATAVKPKGYVHYADTYGKFDRSGNLLPLVDFKAINDEIDQRFSRVGCSPDDIVNWTWRSPSSDFLVVSNGLQKLEEAKPSCLHIQ